MKKVLRSYVVICCCLLLPTVGVAGKGYMGGAGKVSVVEEPVVTETSESEGGVPDTVEGPLNDKKSASGKLFGDLYKLLRQRGGVGDSKLVPQVDGDGVPIIGLQPPDSFFLQGIQLFDESNSVTGGEPILTVVDPPGSVNNYKDYGWFAVEIGTNDYGDPIYAVAQSPYPAQCVQPVASYERWGDISEKTGLTKNRLPMVITYDATWGRSECEVGELLGTPTVNVETGDITFTINEYFVKPCLSEDGSTIDGAVCTWEDPVNGVVSYPHGIRWADLLGEVHFGRLNISRSPEAVLQAAFDEAINNINSPDTTSIKIDPAGRLLLTKEVYDENKVDPATGLPVKIGTVEKAIDSPLENIALYVKLMQDGHLVTPGDERTPIDRSKNGGIPLWKLLGMTDGPAAAALRPTIDIDKMKYWGLQALVIPEDDTETYWTFYKCIDADNTEHDCLVWSDDPKNPELIGEWVANPLVVDRILKTVADQQECPKELLNGETIYLCEGPFTGITTNDAGAPDATDLNFAAAFLAAAADKTGGIDVDMVVYLNSILGINKVVGYSEYDVDGNPSKEAINYEENPIYFNYSAVNSYNRTNTFGVGARGQAVGGTGGNGLVPTYDGKVTVLWGGESSGVWAETAIPLLDRRLPWGYVVWGVQNGTVLNTLGVDNIQGFTQQADDDLSVVDFIHTYQIPGLR